ncbi:class I SAM-dependent methyltransferase [Acidobacteriota bacterium]
MSNKTQRVCPAERAGSLDRKIRRWWHNPQKILRPYIKEGVTALDLGCGPGFFTVDMAQMVGKSGRIIAVDLQKEMLRKLKAKIRGTELEERITLHLCGENRIGVSDKVDFILAFYVVHEIPNHEELFFEMGSILKPSGQVLLVEPPFHVSKQAFEETIGKARSAGLTPVERPKILFSKAVILIKNLQ